MNNRILGKAGKQPEIDYPCTWTYQVIVSNPDAFKRALEKFLTGFEYELQEGKKSRQATYQSYYVRVRVNSQDDRLFIYQALSQCQDIHYIL